MASFQFFHSFIGLLGTKQIDMAADTFKAILTDTAPSAADNEALGDIVQIASGNGYATDGTALTVTWGETAPGEGIWKWVIANFFWLATGGSIAQFRYLVIYDDTAAGKPLIGFWDYGAEVNVTASNRFLVNYDTLGPIKLRIAAL